MTRHPQEMILKYFNALKKLKSVLDYTDSISMNDFAIKNELSKNFGTILVQNGIIKNEGGRGLSAAYKWNSIEPSREMAIETLKKLNKYNSDHKKESRRNENKNTKEIKVSPNIHFNSPKINYQITYLLWGLIKIKTEIHYEPSFNNSDLINLDFIEVFHDERNNNVHAISADVDKTFKVEFYEVNILKISVNGEKYFIPTKDINSYNSYLIAGAHILVFSKNHEIDKKRVVSNYKKMWLK